MFTKHYDPSIDHARDVYSAHSIDGFVEKYSFDDVISASNSSKKSGVVLHIGLDSEYVFNPNTKSNVILSYQYVTSFGDTGVIYTSVGKELKDGVIKSIQQSKFKNKAQKGRDRKSLNDILVAIVENAKILGHFTGYPSEIVIYAHFLRADLASCSDFFNYKVKLKNTRNTVAGFADFYGVDEKVLGGKRFKPAATLSFNRNSKPIKIRFIDTLLLSPNGSSLEKIGDLIHFAKVKIPAPYSIERMDEFLAGDSTAFRRYGLQDSKVALFYGLLMQAISRVEMGLTQMPMTLAGIGLACFVDMCRQKDFDLDVLFGRQKVTYRYWNALKGRSKARVTTELTASKDLFNAFASHAYIGGRNEAFEVGLIPAANINDFDLTMAYPTAMVHLKPLNYQKSYMANDARDFTIDKVGFAYVSFQFPENTLYPSLPVKTENGLVYPLSSNGCYVTSPEIAVALEMGCDINIIHGVIVPFVEDSEPLFLDFIQRMFNNR